MKSITLLFALLITSTSFSQVEKSSELHKTLALKDSLLFNEGLNKCNLELMKTLIHSDFEFYHDKGGAQSSKEAFFMVVSNGPCASGNVKNKRVLVPNSLTVFPLYQNGILYGAVQHGSHQFADTTARFTHLWLLDNKEWKIARVLSYDH
ncbi:nuclear transport factor 2 family protein [Lacinutrix salivirga]